MEDRPTLADKEPSCAVCITYAMNTQVFSNLYCNLPIAYVLHSMSDLPFITAEAELPKPFAISLAHHISHLRLQLWQRSRLDSQQNDAAPS